MSSVMLTKEQIESWRECFSQHSESGEFDALCNMALAYLETQKWSEWKGEGPTPASWFAINPQTGERTKVYRSYEDYVND